MLHGLRCHVSLFTQIYELRVMETKPDKAVSIIECDMNVSMWHSTTAASYKVKEQMDDRTRTYRKINAFR